MQIVHSVTQLGVAVNAVNADSSVASHLNRSVGFFLVPSYREKKKTTTTKSKQPSKTRSPHSSNETWFIFTRIPNGGFWWGTEDKTEKKIVRTMHVWGSECQKRAPSNAHLLEMFPSFAFDLVFNLGSPRVVVGMAKRPRRSSLWLLVAGKPPALKALRHRKAAKLHGFRRLPTCRTSLYPYG